MSVKQLKPKKENPSLATLYGRYDEITENHCKYLLHHLYTHNITEWINPITKKEVQRDSPITVSFLSKCYYGEWSEKFVIIKGNNLKFKNHVEKFIHEAYLYDVRNRPSPKRKSPPIPNLTPAATPPPGAASSGSHSPAGAPLPRSKSPLRVPVTAVTQAQRQQPQQKSPPGAATNRPRRASQSPPGAATNKPKSSSSSGSSAKLDFSPKSINSIVKNTGSYTNADKLTENDCIELVKEIRKKKRGKTAEEIKLLTFINPITNREIPLKSPIFKSFMSKCYFTFNHNKELQKSIKKIVNIKSLDLLNEKLTIIDKGKRDAQAAKDAKRLAFLKKEEEKRLALEETKKKMKEKIPIIDKYIEGLVDELNVHCDELIANCDEKGVLREYKYISNVINSIIIIIYTKYLHLPYYYNELYMNFSSQLDLKVFMYDETFREYYESKSLFPWQEFKKHFYGSAKIIYQKNDLTRSVDHTNIILDPYTIENYHLNTLINRQHVFEAFRYDNYNGNDYKNHIIQYNKINTSYYSKLHFGHYMFPDSLKFAKEVINELNINYNITNGLLPKTIFCATTDATIGTNKPFSELNTIINDILGKLPTITGIAKDTSLIHQYYDGIIKDMRDISYGNNETEYGDDDMIRKNILYSLNAQDPVYIQNNMDIYRQDLYYNYEYTGTFPLFSWIPLNHKNIDSDTNLKYCYPMTTKWQPFEIDSVVLKLLELDYKNHGIKPYSTYLNETIYKVITESYTSVKSLVHANRIQDMTLRIINTIGVYKDKTIKQDYKNKKIYLYHGTKNRLHSIGGKEKEIEILGFLSTSLNVYTASYYSGISQNNVGLIYIIEVDDTHSYINLKDLLNQILILPQSRLRIVREFYVGGICLILCRLIRTPTIKQNNLLYNKLLDQNALDIKFYVTYRITTNTNIMPKCAYILGDLWKINKEPQFKEDFEIYKVKRSDLNNKMINDKWEMTHRERKDEFIYFSLGQEYELYVNRGIPLISGSLEDIKYSIHQHFIKDCYTALGIPCIDYIFIHGANKTKDKIAGTQFNKNPICTGILLKDYKNNRTNQYKYNINNFLIDSIFKFDSIKHDNKKLNLHETLDDDNKYADKIEGFRDAGAYLNGVINQLFTKDSLVGEHIQYMRDWKHLFIKYKNASEDDLRTHFTWCHERIKKLIKIISSVSENYLFFISKTLKGNTKTSQHLGREGVLFPNTQEYNELYSLIKNLEETLLERAKFYKNCTFHSGGMDAFVDFVRNILGDGPLGALENTHNSKLYKHAILEDLILNDSFSGGILSMKEMKKRGLQFKTDTDKPKQIDHMKIYEAFKNVPISESKDMRKFKDMPKDMQEYYGGGKDEKGKYINTDKYIDVSNHCHFRFVNKKDSE
jgi:hypothetical protein